MAPASLRRSVTNLVWIAPASVNSWRLGRTKEGRFDASVVAVMLGGVGCGINVGIMSLGFELLWVITYPAHTSSWCPKCDINGLPRSQSAVACDWHPH